VLRRSRKIARGNTPAIGHTKPLVSATTTKSAPTSDTHDGQKRWNDNVFEPGTTTTTGLEPGLSPMHQEGYQSVTAGVPSSDQAKRAEQSAQRARSGVLQRARRDAAQTRTAGTGPVDLHAPAHK